VAHGDDAPDPKIQAAGPVKGSGPDIDRPVAGRYTTGLALNAFVAVLGVLTVLAELARTGWIAELACHFRPQYVVLSLVTAVAGFVLGRRRLAVAALAIMVLNLWAAGAYLAPWFKPSSAGARAADDVTLVSLNLLHRNHDHARVLAYLEQASPDVLVLAELTPRWRAALSDYLATYPFTLAADKRGPWGLGVYSRFPFADARADDLGVTGSVNVAAVLDLPRGRVRLVAAHLVSPTRPGRANWRNQQLQRLAGLLRSSPEAMPRLLIGDLNVTPFSPYFEDLLRSTGMRDARRPQGFQVTWPSWVPAFGVMIDHCIVDPTFPVSSVERGPAVGSDHYPLVVRLSQQAVTR